VIETETEETGSANIAVIEIVSLAVIEIENAIVETETVITMIRLGQELCDVPIQPHKAKQCIKLLTTNDNPYAQNKRTPSVLRRQVEHSGRPLFNRQWLGHSTSN